MRLLYGGGGGGFFCWMGYEISLNYRDLADKMKNLYLEKYELLDVH
jgi:hypothetical protein